MTSNFETRKLIAFCYALVFCSLMSIAQAKIVECELDQKFNSFEKGEIKPDDFFAKVLPIYDLFIISNTPANQREVSTSGYVMVKGKDGESVLLVFTTPEKGFGYVHKPSPELYMEKTNIVKILEEFKKTESLVINPKDSEPAFQIPKPFLEKLRASVKILKGNRALQLIQNSKDLKKPVDPQLWSDVVEMEPENLNFYLQRAMAYLNIPDYSKAYDDLKRVETVEKKSAYIYGNLGLCSSALKRDHKESLEYFAKAITLNPNGSYNFSNRSNVYFDAQEFPKALEDINKALDLCAQDDVGVTEGLHLTRAQIYDKLGKFDEAKKDREFAKNTIQSMDDLKNSEELMKILEAGMPRQETYEQSQERLRKSLPEAEKAKIVQEFKNKKIYITGIAGSGIDTQVMVPRSICEKSDNTFEINKTENSFTFGRKFKNTFPKGVNKNRVIFEYKGFDFEVPMKDTSFYFEGRKIKGDFFVLIEDIVPPPIPNAPWVRIEGKNYVVGDVVNGATIKEIKNESVVFELDGQKIEIEFKNTDFSIFAGIPITPPAGIDGDGGRSGVH